MFSRVLCIAFSLGVVISVATGLVRERRSAYETALKCSKAGWNASVSVLLADEGPRIEDGCIYFREFTRCLIAVDPAEYSSPFPNIVHFLIVYEWQHSYIAEKASLCKNLMVAELKKMALESGLVEKENLANVEKDNYEPCVGVAMRKCVIREQILLRQAISRDFLAAITDYISCFEETAFTCGALMLRHFIFTLKAYRKHLEEKNGEYGKLIDKVHVPSQ